MIPRHPLIPDGGERFASEVWLLVLFAIVLGGFVGVLLIVGVYVFGGAL